MSKCQGGRKRRVTSSVSRNESLGGKAQTGITSTAIHSFIQQTLRVHSVPGTGLGAGNTPGKETDKPSLPHPARRKGCSWLGTPLAALGRGSGHIWGLLSPQRLLFLTPQLITGLKFLGTCPGTMGPASVSLLLPLPSSPKHRLMGLQGAPCWVGELSFSKGDELPRPRPHQDL